ncbi:SlyX family protein [Maricaulis sp. D1M11]|uniref:SlyX family protein n=1 Tax=Maricaulis sp. D1M11 TaxID=3076117 RepID=UPI0039B3BAC0
MRDPMTDRMESVEIHLAHQDKVIEELNQVILAQREEIDRLTRRLDKMHSRVGTLEDHLPAAEATKPPHY